MNSKTLVKVTANGDYLSFRTITRERKSPHSFMIAKSSIGQLYQFRTTFCEYDSGSFVQMWQERLDRTVHFRFFWLCSDGSRLTGWEQTIILPYQELSDFNNGYRGSQWTLFSLDEIQYPKLVFCATDNLHKAVENPIVRRKLSRFFRDNFKWRDVDEIHFYNDSTPYSFFFKEMMHDGRTGICGGVILHGQDNMKTAKYAIHT